MWACCGVRLALRRLQGEAGGDDVFPGGLAALGARHDVVEGQVVIRVAVLAGKLVRAGKR